MHSFVVVQGPEGGVHTEFAVAGLTEGHIDLLLLEEFVSSEPFQTWFFKQALGADQPAVQLLSARRSVTQSTGESDLEVFFGAAAGYVCCLLIENKVNASFQPEQAERYRLRGQNYVDRGDCTVFFTVLVAPEQYYGKADALKGFDARISYEAMQHWFLEQETMGARGLYKAKLLGAAIEKAERGYQLEEDAPTTAFGGAYWQVAREVAPELEMQEPHPKPAGSSFAYFHPGSLPSDVVLVHKMPHGNVDLQLKGMGQRLAELREAFGPQLQPDMRIERAAGSGVIRIRVATIDAGGGFEEQRDRVTAALEAARRLLAWYLDQSASS